MDCVNNNPKVVCTSPTKGGFLSWCEFLKCQIGTTNYLINNYVLLLGIFSWQSEYRIELEMINERYLNNSSSMDIYTEQQLVEGVVWGVVVNNKYINNTECKLQLNQIKKY